MNSLLDIANNIDNVGKKEMPVSTETKTLRFQNGKIIIINPEKRAIELDIWQGAMVPYVRSITEYLTVIKEIFTEGSDTDIQSLLNTGVCSPAGIKGFDIRFGISGISDTFSIIVEAQVWEFGDVTQIWERYVAKNYKEISQLLLNGVMLKFGDYLRRCIEDGIPNGVPFISIWIDPWMLNRDVQIFSTLPSDITLKRYYVKNRYGVGFYIWMKNEDCTAHCWGNTVECSYPMINMQPPAELEHMIADIRKSMERSYVNQLLCRAVPVSDTEGVTDVNESTEFVLPEDIKSILSKTMSIYDTENIFTNPESSKDKPRKSKYDLTGEWKPDNL